MLASDSDEGFGNEVKLDQGPLPEKPIESFNDSNLTEEDFIEGTIYKKDDLNCFDNDQKYISGKLNKKIHINIKGSVLDQKDKTLDQTQRKFRESLMKIKSLEDLRTLILDNNNQDLLNPANISVALTQLSKLTTSETVKDETLTDHEVVNTSLKFLCQQLYDQIGEVRQVDLASSIQVLGKLEYHPGEKILDNFVLQALSPVELEYTTTVGLGQIAYGLAKLKVQYPELMEEIAEKSKVSINSVRAQTAGDDQFTLASLSALFYAFTKLEYYDDPLFVMIAQNITELKDQFRANYLQMVLYCVDEWKMEEPVFQMLKIECLKWFADNLDQLHISFVPQLMHYTVKQHRTTLMKQILKRVIKDHDQIKAKQMASMAISLMQENQHVLLDQDFRKLIEQLTKRMDQVSLNFLCNVMEAMGKGKVTNLQFIEKLKNKLKDDLLQVQFQNCTGALWGFSRLGVPDKVLVDLAMERFLRMQSDPDLTKQQQASQRDPLTGKSVVELIFVMKDFYKYMNCERLHQQVYELACQLVLQSYKTLPPYMVHSLMTGLFVAKYRNPELMEEIGSYIAKNVQHHNLQYLCDILEMYMKFKLPHKEFMDSIYRKFYVVNQDFMQSAEWQQRMFKPNEEEQKTDIVTVIEKQKFKSPHPQWYIRLGFSMQQMNLTVSPAFYVTLTQIIQNRYEDTKTMNQLNGADASRLLALLSRQNLSIPHLQNKIFRQISDNINRMDDLGLANTLQSTAVMQLPDQLITSASASVVKNLANFEPRNLVDALGSIVANQANTPQNKIIKNEIMNAILKGKFKSPEFNTQDEVKSVGPAQENSGLAGKQMSPHLLMETYWYLLKDATQFEKSFMTKLQDKILENVGAYSQRQIASTLYLQAQGKCYNKTMVSKLLQRFIARVDQSTPQQLADVAHAMNIQGYCDPDFLEIQLVYMIEHFSGFKQQQLTDCLSCLAQFSFNIPQNFHTYLCRNMYHRFQFMTQRDFIFSIWAMAALDIIDLDMCNAVHFVQEKYKVAPFKQQELSRLWQAKLLVDRHGKLISRDNEVMEQVPLVSDRFYKPCYEAYVESLKTHKRSNFSRQIQEELQKAGATIEEGVMTDDGSIRIDCAIQLQNEIDVAVLEVENRNCAINPPHQLLIHPQIIKRILEAQNWGVLVVTRREWNAAENKQQYLLEKLKIINQDMALRSFKQIDLSNNTSSAGLLTRG